MLYVVLRDKFLEQEPLQKLVKESFMLNQV